MASAYFTYFIPIRQSGPDPMQFVETEPYSDAEVTITDSDSGNYFFQVGESLTFEGGPAWSLTYVASYGDSIVTLRSTGEYYLFSNSTSVGSGPFTASATPFPACFLAGTSIATPDGARAIEDLAIGDEVLGADGAVRPIRWIGRQDVVAVFADPMKAWPIRIAAGALGDGLPARDLRLSPDHALLLDGLLVQAGALVNGTTITRHAPQAERFTYFHIELADHALILAEGVPAETFVDNVTRRRFDNYAEYEALHGTADAAIPELDLPRVKSARQLPAALRARLQRRADGPDEAGRAA